MEELSVRDIVFVNFPFSNLKDAKLRPAVILADAQKGDWILCQITSKSYADPKSIEINQCDFETGSLSITSYIRAAKIFTAHESIISKKAGRLKQRPHQQVIDTIIHLLSNDDTYQG